MRNLTLLAIALILVCTSAAAQPINTNPDVNISKMPSYQNECAIAKDPTNHQRLFAACNNGGSVQFSPRLFAAPSTDQPTVAAGAGQVWIVWNQSGSMVARGAFVTGLGAVGAFGPVQSIPGTSGCSFGDLAISPGGAVVQV